MRNSLVLTASLLLIPALPSAAAPPVKGPLPIKGAAAGAAISVEVDPRPAAIHDVGGGFKLTRWNAVVKVTKGSHSVTVVHRNAVAMGDEPGAIKTETFGTTVKAGRPQRFDVQTWGPRPIIGARINQSSDGGQRPPAQTPAEQPPAAEEPPAAEQPPAPKQPPAAEPPAEQPPADKPVGPPGIKRGPSVPDKRVPPREPPGPRPPTRPPARQSPSR